VPRVLGFFSGFCGIILSELQIDPQQVCRMDLPGPTTLVGTRTDYSVGPWDYPTCAPRYLLV
jgi:hypothetical protein